MPKIFDCVLFFNELELLELRMKILGDYVDYFYIVEADRTFSVKVKPLYFLENIGKFDWIKHKIMHKVVHLSESTNNAWINETQQRNSLVPDGWDDNDIIITSDLDEIPDPKLLTDTSWVKADVVYHLKQQMFYYTLNNQLLINWYGSRICRRSRFKTTAPDSIRTTGIAATDQNNEIVDPGGWHFSYLGSIQQIRSKIESFSHTELNTDTIKSNIAMHIANGNDLFGRNLQFREVEIDNTFPEYIVNNQDKLKHLIKGQIHPAHIVVEPTFTYTGWELPPNCLISIQQLLIQRAVTHLNIVEFGSGKSTTVMKEFVKVNELPGVYDNFDADPRFKHPEATLKNLVVFDPMAYGPDYVFYDLHDSDFSSNQYNLVILDGHHGHGRSRAFVHLKDKLAPGCLVVIDDYDHYSFENDFLMVFPNSKLLVRHWEQNNRWIVYEKF